MYLLTAKHVLFTKPEGTNAPALRSPTAVVKSFSNAGTTNITACTLVINLIDAQSAGEVRFSINRDVALVRLEECNLTNANLVRLVLPIMRFSSSYTGLTVGNETDVCPAKQIEVGSDVFMFGYPTSLTGPISGIFDPSEPLLRKGVVAGINLEKKTVIIDCPSYFGNSGGPVIQVERLGQDLTRLRVIGIVTGFVPFQEEWVNKTMGYSHIIASNSGYTVIEPMDSVLDLVWK